MLSKLVARHSAKPTGLLGRFVFGRYLDRANRRMHSLMHDALDYDAGSKILEVGFGGGALLLQIAANLQQGRIEGIDVSDEMLTSLKRRVARLGIEAKVGLHRASVEALPFAGESFDRVCSAHTIYFWPDLAGGIGEIGRVTKPGGLLVLGFSSKESLVEAGWAEHGFRAYGEAEIEQACRAKQFAVDRIDTVPHPQAGHYHVLRAIKSG